MYAEGKVVKDMSSDISQNFPAMRWVNISLRTFHLIGVAGVGGAFLYNSPQPAWEPYLLLLVTSGAGMLLLDIWSNTQSLVQVRGIATIVKIIILLIAFYTGMEAYFLITVVVISGIMSHAPGRVRYRVVFGRSNTDNPN